MSHLWGLQEQREGVELLKLLIGSGVGHEGTKHFYGGGDPSRHNVFISLVTFGKFLQEKFDFLPGGWWLFGW